MCSAAYRIAGHFADVDEFVQLIWSQLPRSTRALDAKPAIVKQLRQIANAHPVLARDLDLLCRETQENWSELQRPFGDRVSSFQDQAANVLRTRGLPYEPPPVRVVDKFPKPFDATSFDALTIDKFDECDFGIPRGIYFLRSKVVPDLAIHTYAHEMIHHLISDHTSERLLARGIEEGLCELFGALFLESQIRGLDVAEAIHRNSMFAYTSDRFWDNYVHHTRQFLVVYKSIGIPGLVEVIRKGRSYLKNLETAFLTADWHPLLPSGFSPPVSDEFERMLERLFLGFNRNYVVTPEIYQIAAKLQPGVTLKALAESTGKRITRLRKMLRGFQEEHFLLLIDGDRIQYSDVQMYLEAGNLRYSLESAEDR